MQTSPLGATNSPSRDEPSGAGRVPHQTADRDAPYFSISSAAVIFVLSLIVP